jgi:hypothetical protein
VGDSEITASSARKSATKVNEDPTERSGEKGRCTTCLEPIWIGAKKCTLCDSYQDWRRFLTFSSTVLALLVSLVAVSTTAFSIAMGGIWRYSDVHIYSRPIAENGHVYFLVTNKGTRPATAEFVTITLDTDHPKYFWLHLVRPGPGAALLPAGDTKELDYTDQPQFPAEDEANAWDLSKMTSDAPIRELDQKNCSITIKTRSFKGLDSDTRFLIPCKKFHGSLEHYWQNAHKEVEKK